MLDLQCGSPHFLRKSKLSRWLEFKWERSYPKRRHTSEHSKHFHHNRPAPFERSSVIASVLVPVDIVLDQSRPESFHLGGSFMEKKKKAKQSNPAVVEISQIHSKTSQTGSNCTQLLFLHFSVLNTNHDSFPYSYCFLL